MSRRHASERVQVYRKHAGALPVPLRGRGPRAVLRLGEQACRATCLWVPVALMTPVVNDGH